MKHDKSRQKYQNRVRRKYKNQKPAAEFINRNPKDKRKTPCYGTPDKDTAEPVSAVIIAKKHCRRIIKDIIKAQQQVVPEPTQSFRHSCLPVFQNRRKHSGGGFVFYNKQVRRALFARKESMNLVNIELEISA